jgi:hypothetical protein
MKNDSAKNFNTTIRTGPFLHFAFALLLVLAWPAVGQAQFTFTTNDGAITITGYTGTNTVVTTPSTTNGLPVTSIGDNAFGGCTSLTNVTIPDNVTNIGRYVFGGCISLISITVDTNNPSYSSVSGVLFNKSQTVIIAYPEGLSGSYTVPNGVTSIGDFAFAQCTSLTNVTIPDSITSIGDYAFFYCTSLTNVTIPNSVTSIGGWAFDGCRSLTSVTIPNSVTTIGDNAFGYCASLTNVTISDSVTNIGVFAFTDCTSLTSITVDTNNPSYSSAAGILFNKSWTALIAYPGGLSGSYIIPDTVTSIRDFAFGYCASLTNVTIPNSVTNIGGYAFYDCYNLTSVTIGNGVTSIRDFAFGYCISLTSVTIPDSVTNIGNGAFVDCTRLVSITVDTNNPSYSSVAGVLLNKSQTVLIAYPDGLSRSYTIPNCVTSIGDAAFIGCASLTNVTIPNSVTTIGDNAFSGCGTLTSVTIPNSVTSIGDWAFSYCPSLTTAYFSGNAPSGDNTVFLGETGTVYYLPGTTGWSSTFGGWPTAPWYQPQPRILGSGNGLGATTNGFSFTISWATNVPIVVEACTNLANPIWTPVATNALTNGTFNFRDPKWTNYPGRFYRIRSP